MAVSQKREALEICKTNPEKNILLRENLPVHIAREEYWYLALVILFDLQFCECARECIHDKNVGTFMEVAESSI